MKNKSFLQQETDIISSSLIVMIILFCVLSLFPNKSEAQSFPQTYPTCLSSWLGLTFEVDDLNDEIKILEDKNALLTQMNRNNDSTKSHRGQLLGNIHSKVQQVRRRLPVLYRKAGGLRRGSDERRQLNILLNKLDIVLLESSQADQEIPYRPKRQPHAP